MSKKRVFLIFIAASVSAFLGGFVSNQLYLSANAAANDNGKQQSIQPLPEFKVVEANQFRLVQRLINSVFAIGNTRYPYCIMTSYKNKENIIH